MRLAADRGLAVVCALGTAQTIAWGSSYYLPAVLAVPAAAELGLRPVWIFGAFSAALVISALVGPMAGRMVDRHGGRGLLAASNLVFALGLAGFALVTGPVGLLAAWAVLGLGMGLGLYDTAFAALASIYGRAARSPITGITLIAGFASTVGWPLTGFLEASFGWREACLVWAALHLVLALPLNLILPSPGAQAGGAGAGADAPDPPRSPAPEAGRHAAALGPAPRSGAPAGFWLLAFVFAVVAFTSTAMAAHLPRLLEASGASSAAAIAAGALIGPAQVAARLVEFGLLRRVHPLISARIAALAHPLGAALLLALGAPMAAAFTVIHGAGTGLLTISRGTLPLALFGPGGYGHRLGVLAAPSRIAQAAAPLVFGLAVSGMGAGAIWLTAGLSLLAVLALLAIRPTLA